MERSSPPDPARLGLLLALAIVATLMLPATARSSPAFEPRVVEERTLSSPAWAFDLRWTGDDSVAVAAGRAGLYQVPLGDPGAAPRRIPGSEQAEYATRLAVSGDDLVTAAPFGILTWRRGDGTWRQDAPMGPGGTVGDLDVRDGRLLLLGGRRLEVPGEEKPQWAPEGGILFSSSLERPDSLRRLMTAASGPGGKALEMALCQVLEPSAVRFLSGDRYAVVPGFQPGVLVYRGDGTLLRAWDSAELGIHDACPPDWTTSAQISRDMDRRIARLQRYPILDDLVPWGEWFALLVRRPTAGGATWDFIPYDEAGAGAAVPLPVKAAGPGVRLRADSRGSRLALLLSDHQEGDGGTPAHPHRLVILETAPAGEPQSAPPETP